MLRKRSAAERKRGISLFTVLKTGVKMGKADLDRNSYIAELSGIHGHGKRLRAAPQPPRARLDGEKNSDVSILWHEILHDLSFSTFKPSVW